MPDRSPCYTTISAHVLLRIVDFCTRRGHSALTLCHSAGLDYAWLQHKTTRVPLEMAERLCTSALELVDDDQLGLHLAEDVGNGAYYDLGVLLMMACPTLGDALARLERTMRFWGDGERLAFIHRADGLVIRSLLDGHSKEFVRHSQECALAEIALGARALSGKNVRARLVRFAHGTPLNVDEHERIFACPLHFDAAASEIEFDKAALATPMRHASDAFVGVFEKQMAQALEQLPRLNETTEKVREYIRSAMGRGSVGLSHVARRLGKSERSLQRHLSREGTSFASIVDAVRRQLAIAYLNGNVPLAEVASLLGYADVTAFYHAFRRWTGRSPAEFRASHQQCGDMPET